MHPFAYRAPRHELAIPVEFAVENGVLFGTVRNISEEGLLADFGEPLLTGTSGRLRFRADRCLLELEARIVYTDGFHIGIAFDFSSSQEQSLFRSILQVVSSSPKA